MKWEVQVNVDTLDLKELSKSLVDDEFRVLEKNRQYFLESNRFEELTNSEETLMSLWLTKKDENNHGDTENTESIEG